MGEITRRRLLKAAPLIALVAVPAVEAAAPASSLRALYDEWQATKEAYTALCDIRTDEAEAILERMLAIERTVADFVPETIEDFAFKAVFADDDGDMDLNTYAQAALLRMAYAIAGVDAPDRSDDWAWNL